MSLAKATHTMVAFFGLFFVLVWIFFAFSWFLFLLFLALLFICRNSQKNVLCSDSKAILAPLCGRVEKITNVKHPNLGECVELVIKNALYNEGIIRACAKMRINEVKFRHGLFSCEPNLAAFNERVLILASSEGVKFAFRVSAGCLERKIELYEGLGELEAGTELGFSLNSRLSLLLPKKTRLLVATGDEIAPCTLLGYF